MSAKQALQKAIDQYKSGNLAGSVAGFEGVIDKHPDNPDAHNLLGVVLGAMGKNQSAISSIKKAIEISPDNASFHFNLALVYKKLYRLQEAVSACREAIKVKSDYYPALKELIIILRYLGKKEEALEVAKQTIKFHPEKAESYNLIGEVYEGMMNLSEAEKSYRKAIELAPDFYHPYSNLGNIKHNLQQKDEAKKFFEKSLELNPNQPIIRHSLASITGETPERPPEQFIESLFDRYADDFDSHMKNLGYKVPELIFSAVKKVKGGKVKDLNIIDLGCGTGTSGRLFRPFAKNITGVDLSAKMLEMAAKERAYDNLLRGDVIEALKQQKQKCDLIIAADVFIYVGILDEFFLQAANTLVKGGLMAFSIEEDEGIDYNLHSTGRYKHSSEYIKRLADKNAFKIRHDEQAGIRIQFDKPIPGRVMVLEKE